MPAPSLLERLSTSPAPEDWARYVDLFTPILYRWVIRCGVPGESVEAVLRELIATLAIILPSYRLTHAGTPFGSWLWIITQNTVENWKIVHPESVSSPGTIAPAGNLHPDGPDTAEYESVLFSRALRYIEQEHPELSWQAFRLVVLEGHPADQVARQLGLDVAAVQQARTQILARLQGELAGMIGPGPG